MTHLHHSFSCHNLYCLYITYACITSQNLLPTTNPSDMSHCDHRVWLELNGPELHIYNRSELYARLEKLFGQESQMGVGKGSREEDDEMEEDPQQQPRQTRDMSFWQDWRDLIPVIKIELNMVRSWVKAYTFFFVSPLVDDFSVFLKYHFWCNFCLPFCSGLLFIVFFPYFLLSHVSIVSQEDKLHF